VEGLPNLPYYQFILSPDGRYLALAYIPTAADKDYWGDMELDGLHLVAIEDINLWHKPANDEGLFISDFGDNPYRSDFSNFVYKSNERLSPLIGSIWSPDGSRIISFCERLNICAITPEL
jgi:hypothetical protein